MDGGLSDKGLFCLSEVNKHNQSAIKSFSIHGDRLINFKQLAFQLKKISFYKLHVY